MESSKGGFGSLQVYTDEINIDENINMLKILTQDVWFKYDVIYYIIHFQDDITQWQKGIVKSVQMKVCICYIYSYSLILSQSKYIHTYIHRMYYKDDEPDDMYDTFNRNNTNTGIYMYIERGR